MSASKSNKPNTRGFNSEQTKFLELAYTANQDWTEEVFEKLIKITRRTRVALQDWFDVGFAFV